MIKRKNSNSLALSESRVQPQDRNLFGLDRFANDANDLGSNDPFTNMDVTVAHRLPNLPRMRKDDVRRQQRPFMIFRAAKKIIRVEVVCRVAPFWKWWKFRS